MFKAPSTNVASQKHNQHTRYLGQKSVSYGMTSDDCQWMQIYMQLPMLTVANHLCTMEPDFMCMWGARNGRLNEGKLRWYMQNGKEQTQLEWVKASLPISHCYKTPNRGVAQTLHNMMTDGQLSWLTDALNACATVPSARLRL